MQALQWSCDLEAEAIAGLGGTCPETVDDLVSRPTDKAEIFYQYVCLPNYF
ncbi:unnamed protein product [Strongylus vulgaris]|uniref:Uncharacterized protein n=1 Tax=Strongylus vulgaris TaxID=40348 RepID=A0A3P7J2D2_STRVU|nr:unnamed protein product [Strongylus vulgaris]